MKITKTTYTPAGMVVKSDYTNAQITSMASEGDVDAKKEIAKDKIAKSFLDTDKLAAIIEYLGL